MKTVVLRDGTEMTVNEEQAVAIDRMIDQKQEFMKINDVTLYRTEIRLVKPGGIDVPTFGEDRQIAEPAAKPIAGGLKDNLKKRHPETYEKLYGKKT